MVCYPTPTEAQSSSPSSDTDAIETPQNFPDHNNSFKNKTKVLAFDIHSKEAFFFLILSLSTHCCNSHR
jgi:hypothetical protein